MRFELQKLHRRLGVTSLYVTHDQVEAMTLGQRIIVMNAGRAEQVGTPAEIYARPATTFVAGFIGSPAMNFLDGAVESGGFRLPGGQLLSLAMPGAARLPAGPAVLGLRPEHLTPADDGVPAQVRVVELMGDHAVLHAEVAGLARPLVAFCDGHAALRAGAPCRLACDSRRGHIFADGTPHARNVSLGG